MTTQYDPASYRRYLKISSRKHILVEGQHDKYIIERLWSSLANQTEQTSQVDGVVVDSADRLIKFPSGRGNNREKVVHICASIKDQAYWHKFVGFIDRELYQFGWDTSDSLQDHLQSHHVNGRLIRSRGHSIENYLFEFETFKSPLELLSTTPQAHLALDRFQQIFTSVLQQACAVSLVAAKLKIIQRIEGTIDWQLIKFSTQDTQFLFEQWAERLMNKRACSDSQITQMRQFYQTYFQLVQKAEFVVLRWICHGHLGLRFLISAYQRCLIEVSTGSSNPNKEINRIGWVPDKEMSRVLANWWVNRALQGGCEYPLEIFKLITVIK